MLHVTEKINKACAHHFFWSPMTALVPTWVLFFDAVGKVYIKNKAGKEAAEMVSASGAEVTRWVSLLVQFLLSDNKFPP